MSAISIRDVGKSYGPVQVMEGINVDIEPGEFVVLVGPSGCGKSTLLRMVAGLEEITAGEIEIAGRVVNKLSPKERDIAMVFQNYALYPHMTVLENMGFSLKLERRPEAEMREKVAPAAEILGLTDYLDRYPRQLSGGQRQRVAMGRAMVRNPTAFLFDEPLSNLDAKLRVAMRAEIKALHQRLGSTIIYVTHDQIEAMTMADRIVVLNGGHVEQAGTPLELFDDPANRFVAGFIGSPSMNFMDVKRQGETVTFADGEVFSVEGPMPDSATGEFTIGMRPDTFELDGTGFQVSVTVVEPTGSETLVHAKKAGAPLTMLFRGRPDVRSGSEIRVSSNAESLYCFDRNAGHRLR